MPATTTIDVAPPQQSAPPWPQWATTLANLYNSRTTCVFVLYGNVHDPVGDDFIPLSDYVTNTIFGTWDIVLGYDQSRGLRLAASTNDRLSKMSANMSDIDLAFRADFPLDPDKAIAFLDRVVEKNIMTKQHGIATVFRYGQHLLPNPNGPTQYPMGRLVQFLTWARSLQIKKLNTAFVLVVDRLADLDQRLIESPYVATIEVPMPDYKTRLDFIDKHRNGLSTAWPSATLANSSNGLTLSSLDVILATSNKTELTTDSVGKLKKELIQRQCLGMVEFIEPGPTLDLLIGADAIKEQLQQDAKWVREGDYEMAPMGYLWCGPVGTGKSFGALCAAGSIGIVCLILRNFRGKYVGDTEGNLELILSVLRALGPVMIIIDEADAALGNREASGDPTSGRVFSMIAAQMADTSYRGKIIWMLLTSRPDLLPIDLKRQGRAEVHLPLFYPTGTADTTKMMDAMGRKNKILWSSPDETASSIPGHLGITMPAMANEVSGADIESIVLSARRISRIAGRTVVTQADLNQAADEFLPSVQGMEKELQVIAAVLECSNKKFLPAEWRQKASSPEDRAKLQERLVAIRQLLDSKAI